MLLSLVMLAWAAFPARAQHGPTYCNVTAITAEQLSNAVRVTIVTDGSPEWDIDWESLISEGAMKLTQQPWGMGLWPTARFNHIPIRVRNAKSNLGTGFVAIGKYPVSHVTLSIPEWATEGVGLVIDVAAYLAWITGEGDLTNWRYDFSFARSDDRTSFSVLFYSQRFAPYPPAETPKDLPTEVFVVEHNGLVALRVVNAEVSAVAAAISRETGIPITTPPDGQMRVSLFLEEAIPGDAIEAMARGCGLSATPSAEGCWIIASPHSTEGGYAAASTRVVPLHYLNAAEAVDLLPNFLLAYLRADTETNAVIFTGPSWLAARVEADLTSLDVKPPEVELEAVAVEYSSTDALVRRFNISRYLTDHAFQLAPALSELTVLVLQGLPEGWLTEWEARDSHTETRISAQAKLRVASGRQARIFAGQQRYIVVQQAGEFVEPDLRPADTGTTLEVQPRVGAGNELVVRISLSLKTFRGVDLATGLPVVGIRSSEQVVRVSDGDTIVLTGLSSDETDRRDRKLSPFSSLPLIGWIFRAVDRTRQQTEMAVFITPHIVRATPAGQVARDRAKGVLVHG